jgi:hypothetical protein
VYIENKADKLYSKYSSAVERGQVLFIYLLYYSFIYCSKNVKEIFIWSIKKIRKIIFNDCKPFILFQTWDLQNDVKMLNNFFLGMIATLWEKQRSFCLVIRSNHLRRGANKYWIYGTFVLKFKTMLRCEFVEDAVLFTPVLNVSTLLIHSFIFM